MLLCAGLLLVTCAGPDEPEIEPAVRAYSEAYLSGNGDEAHARLTARCQERTDLAEFRSITAMAREQYGEAEMTDFAVVQQSDGLARVTYRYDQSTLDQDSEPWALEDGEWRNDDC
jgi:hypothetical protein